MKRVERALLLLLPIASLASGPAVGQVLGQTRGHVAGEGAGQAQGSAPYVEIDVTVFAARNPFLTAGDNAMTTGAQVSASGGATLGIDHGTSLELEGGIAHRRYSRRYGPFVTGDASVALNHRKSERLNLRSQALYRRLLPLEGDTMSIDAAIDPVSLQELYLLQQDVRWSPDEYTTVNGRASWTRLNPRNSTLLSRTDAASVALGMERRLSTASRIGAEGRATWASSRDGSKSDAATFVLQAGSRFAPNLSVQAEAGLSRISRKDSDGTRRGGSGELAALLSVCYDPRRLRLCLTGQVTPAITSIGGIRRERSLDASFSLQTSENGSVNSDVGIRTMPQPEFGRDAQVLRASTTYEHRLGRRFLVHVGADYDRRTGQTRQSFDTWTVRVGAAIRIPSR